MFGRGGGDGEGWRDFEWMVEEPCWWLEMGFNHVVDLSTFQGVGIYVHVRVLGSYLTNP